MKNGRQQFILYALCVVWTVISPSLCPAQSPSRINIPVAEEIDGLPALVVHHSVSNRDKLRDREALGQLSRRVIVAAWEDGTVVWSGDAMRGGEPYFTAQVEPERIAETLAAMCETAQALPEGSHTTRFGPDSSYNSITVRSEACAFNWQSWHEVYEGQGRLVAVDGALTVLPAGRDLEEYRRERSSAEYLLFIDSWRAARQTALSLIPPDPAQHVPAPVMFHAHWTSLDEAHEPIATDSEERERIAAEAVDRLTEDVVNIYMSEWSALPEPEFITQLMAAIDEGRYAEHVWMSARARDVALRRLRSHPEIVYSLLREALEDPIAPHVLGRAVLTLPPEYQVAALADIRELIARDAFTPQKEEFLHAALIGRADRYEPFWLDFAAERFADETTPLNARIAAGAAAFSTMEPGAMLAEVQNTEDATRDASLGALSRLIAHSMTNRVLGAEENLQAARPLIVEALKHGNPEFRKWAAWAGPHVALEFGDHIPHRDKPTADPEVLTAIREAMQAEQDWAIRGTMERGLKELEGAVGVE